MRIRKLAPALVLMAAAVAPLLSARAQSSVDPEKLRLAAEEFDAGRRAFKVKDYARAGAHFENAFRDAPRPEALRMAIRARREGGELARAATLCVRAQALYPDDADTIRVTQAVLGEVAKKLHRLSVRCDPACTLILDGKLVRDDAAASQIIFLSPASHTLVAGWSGDRSESKSLEATEGGSGELVFTAPAAAPSASSAPLVVAPPTSASAIAPAASATLASERSPGLAPVYFYVGAGLTAALAGVTIWSGLDTRSNPGPDKVKSDCVGKGADCPTYQDGLSKERRTNILLGVSAGVAVATGVVGLFFTDWKGGGSSPERAGARRLVPAVAVGDGVMVSASGRF
jgi:hypothetical protein